MVLAPLSAGAGEVTSLKDSVSYAIGHNRMLAASARGVDKAEAQLSEVTGRMLPRVDLSTGYMKTDSPLNAFGTKLLQQQVTAADFAPASLNQPGYATNYQSRLGLSMPLFSGGALWAARSGASNHARATELEYRYRKQQLIFQTISSYVQSSLLLAQVNAAANAVKAAEKRWQDATALQKRGMAIESDVMDAHVHVLRSNVALSDARNRYQASLEQLRLVMGGDATLPLGTMEEPSLAYQPQTLEILLERVSESRHDLKSMESELEAADDMRSRARAGYLPRVDLFASQEWNSDSFGLKNRNSMVGVNVTMNLFSGGSDLARVRAATSDRVMLEYRIADRRQQIANEVSQAWRSLQMAEQRYRSESESMKQTIESLRIKSLRHKQGLEKTSDLLDAQVRADQAEMSYIQARYDLITAKAALLLASGILNEEVVR